MIGKSMIALDRVTDYTKQRDAEWLVTAQKSPSPRLFGDAETATTDK
jgi:hypothetical protein